MAKGVDGCVGTKGAVGCTGKKGWNACPAVTPCDCGACTPKSGDTITVTRPTYQLVASPACTFKSTNYLTPPEELRDMLNALPQPLPFTITCPPGGTPVSIEYSGAVPTIHGIAATWGAPPWGIHVGGGGECWYWSWTDDSGRYTYRIELRIAMAVDCIDAMTLTPDLEGWCEIADNGGSNSCATLTQLGPTAGIAFTCGDYQTFTYQDNYAFPDVVPANYTVGDITLVDGTCPPC